MSLRLVLFSLTILMFSCGDQTPEEPFTLNGTWVWQSTCGGIVGCQYPSQDMRRSMIINDTEIKMRENNDFTSLGEYTITYESHSDAVHVYGVLMSDGTDYIMTIEGGKLTMDLHSTIISVYERVE